VYVSAVERPGLLQQALTFKDCAVIVLELQLTPMVDCGVLHTKFSVVAFGIPLLGFSVEVNPWRSAAVVHLAC
jgi:hypothetical protein